MIPPLPTAHASDGPLPHTELNGSPKSARDSDHALPSQCQIVRPPPTAHTSFEPLPQTPTSPHVMVLGVHALPFQCCVSPNPTAQISVALEPQRPFSHGEPVVGTLDQELPFQRSAVP